MERFAPGMAATPLAGLLPVGREGGQGLNSIFSLRDYSG
jgi:hypothetical protein